MVICPHCDYSNREGTFMCIQCGTPLQDASVSTLSTRAVVGGGFLPFNPNDSVTEGWSQTSRAALYLKDTKTMFPLEAGSLSYVLGRTSETELAYDDTGIDLTPHFAQLKGVSRIHAVMRRTPTALTIADMKSTNGTLINGKRLIPERPYALQNDDQITLGKLALVFRLLKTTKHK